MRGTYKGEGFCRKIRHFMKDPWGEVCNRPVVGPNSYGEMVCGPHLAGDKRSQTIRRERERSFQRLVDKQRQEAEDKEAIRAVLGVSPTYANIRAFLDHNYQRGAERTTNAE